MLYVSAATSSTLPTDGARSPYCGRIEGCSAHGILSNDDFRFAWVERVKPGCRPLRGYDGYEASVEKALDDLADGLEAALDLDALFASAQQPGWQPSYSED
jgi:adenosylcobyric acid synthase